MKRGSYEDIIVAVDVGTTKICVLVAQLAPDSTFTIVGMGQAPSTGLARGVVVEMAPAVAAVRTALKEAELMAGVALESAYVGISGAHIRACSSHGMIAIKHGEIQQRDVGQVLQAAQAISLPEGQQILHVVPQYFCINGTELVTNPVGMYALRLESRVHIIMGAVASVQNLIRCCETAGLVVRDIILEPLASAEAVLSSDERMLGVGLLDIGGGTSDFALYHKGSISHTHIIPIAGNAFTHDIAVCLRLSLQDAERVKCKYGIIPAADESAESMVAQVDGGEVRMITPEEVTSVVAPRAEELLELLAYEIDYYELRSFMPAGLVITGGGALLSGLREYAAQLLKLPVRIGRPVRPSSTVRSLEHPIYATAYGLLLYARRRRAEEELLAAQGPLLQRVAHKMRAWIYEIF